VPTLTAKKRRLLRSAGQKLRATCIVGKAGVTRAVIGNVDRQLSARELVKVRIPPGPADEREQLAKQLAGAANAAYVATLGRTVLLYRPAEARSPEEKRSLPR